MRWRFSPLASLKIFSLSLTFCSLNMICLSVVFCFFLLDVLTFLDLWFCVCLQCGRFSVIITSNIPSIPFSLSSSGFPIMCALHLLWLSYSSFGILFCLCFSFLSLHTSFEVSVDVSSSSLILSSAVPSLLMSYQGRSLLLLQCSNFSHFLLIRF